MKRPRTITLVAWVFILVGAAGILADLWPLLTPNASHQIEKLRADLPPDPLLPVPAPDPAFLSPVQQAVQLRVGVVAFGRHGTANR